MFMKYIEVFNRDLNTSLKHENKDADAYFLEEKKRINSEESLLMFH